MAIRSSRWTTTAPSESQASANKTTTLGHDRESSIHCLHFHANQHCEPLVNTAEGLHPTSDEPHPPLTIASIEDEIAQRGHPRDRLAAGNWRAVFPHRVNCLPRQRMAHRRLHHLRRVAGDSLHGLDVVSLDSAPQIEGGFTHRRSCSHLLTHRWHIYAIHFGQFEGPVGLVAVRRGVDPCHHRHCHENPLGTPLAMVFAGDVPRHGLDLPLRSQTIDGFAPHGRIMAAVGRWFVLHRGNHLLCPRRYSLLPRRVACLRHGRQHLSLLRRGFLRRSVGGVMRLVFG